MFGSFNPGQLEHAQEDLRIPKRQLCQVTRRETLRKFGMISLISLFVDGLSALVPKKAITDQVRDCVITLAYVYGVDVLSMQNIVLGAVTEMQTIDMERLRKGARDWYQFENGQALPVL